jgi:hypothetical protein
MPPPAVSEQASWESTPTIFQLVEIEGGQLEAGANASPDEMTVEKREAAKEKVGKVSANPPSTSSSSKHESNNGAAPAEPGSELMVWWDEPEDQDPENPMNWSSTKKWVNILVISVISFLV